MPSSYQIILILLFLSIPKINSQTKVIMLIDMFRPGIRSPLVNTYDSSWEFYDELQPAGIRQQYLLGSAIAQNYPNLVGPYNPDTIYVQSADYGPSLMSAVAHVGGLFGMSGGPNLTAEQAALAVPPMAFNTSILDNMNLSALPFNYLPVAIHADDIDSDYLFYSYGIIQCPDASGYVSNNTQTDDYIGFTQLLQPTLNQLNNLGSDSFSFSDAVELYDTLLADYFNGVTSPDPYGQIFEDSDFWNNMTFLNDYSLFYENVGTTTQIQLYSFTIFDQMMHYFNKKIKNTTALNLVVWSGHENSLLPLLAGLQIVNYTCLEEVYYQNKIDSYCHVPSFSSSLLFELWEGDVSDEFYVRTIWDGQIFDICNNASGYCNITQFTQLVNDIVGNMSFGNYLEQCSSPLVLMPVIDNYFEGFVWIFGIVNSLFIILIGMSIRRIFKTKKAQKAEAEKMQSLLGRFEL